MGHRHSLVADVTHLFWNSPTQKRVHVRQRPQQIAAASSCRPTGHPSPRHSQGPRRCGGGRACVGKRKEPAEPTFWWHLLCTPRLICFARRKITVAPRHVLAMFTAAALACTRCDPRAASITAACLPSIDHGVALSVIIHRQACII